jgi:hypothetical protein
MPTAGLAAILRCPFNTKVTMKSLPLIASFAVVAVGAQAQWFTPGNLALLRIGNGSQAIANTGNSMFVEQFTPGGSWVNALPIPDSGASSLILSGTATSEGALVRSADGRYLTFMGYNTAQPYPSSLPATGSATVNRGVGQVDGQGNYTLVTTTSTAFNGTGSSSGNPRSAVTDGSGNYWGLGAGNAASTRGTYYFGTASPAGFVQTGNSPRVAGLVNGNLAYSVSSTTAGLSGINSFSGAPVTTATATQFLFTGDGSSPYDFAFNASLTLAYVADDRNTAAGGIQRYEWDGSTWTLAYTLGTGAANVGARGLAVDFSGPTPVIYATTSEGSANRFITVTDTGSGSLATTLSTAASGTLYRGLDFAPIPEPASAGILLLGLGALLLRRKPGN